MYPTIFDIPDGKNSRLLQLIDRKEFDRKTLDGNEGFILEIPFLEGAFSTKYFVIDKTTGSMMGIYNDKVDKVEAEAQLQLFNLAQLQCVVYMLEQRHQGYEMSSVADTQENNQQDMQQDAHGPQMYKVPQISVPNYT